MKIIIFANTSWNLFHFRKGLIKALIKKGIEVIALAPADNSSLELQNLGCRFIHIPIERKGKNLFKEIRVLILLVKIFLNERPDFLLTFTIKPNIYGSIAASFFNIKVFNNISGLGSAFMKRDLFQFFIKILYKLSLSRVSKVFFQNPDDRYFFVNEGIIPTKKSEIVPGSGINLEEYKPNIINLKINKNELTFLLIGRLLWDKGIREFVEAAEMIGKSADGLKINFQVLGGFDFNNPSAISENQIKKWNERGDVIFLGSTDNVLPYIESSDCVVLPSYREGVPRSLLEAAALEKPLIASDAPGCRDVIDDGSNGFLCIPRDVNDLKNKLDLIIQLTPDQRNEMGRLGRIKMKEEFDEIIVSNKYSEKLQSYPFIV